MGLSKHGGEPTRTSPEDDLAVSLSANLSLERALFWRDIEPPRFIPLLAFVPSLLQFAPKLAIERIRAAAAQRDGKAQQPPQQHIFVAASHPIEAVGPISDRDEQHLDGRSRSKEPREQPEDERNAAQCLDQARGPKPESRRRVTEIGKGFEDGLVRAVQELRINEHDQIPD